MLAGDINIRRLRADGFTVVERARPRRRHDVSVNHGGVAIVAAAGIKLTAVTIGVQPTTFECVAARVTSGMSSCVLLSVYRPGSSAVTASFFSELADVLDRFSTYVHYVEPLVLAGDISGWSAAPTHTQSSFVNCWKATGLRPDPTCPGRDARRGRYS